MSCAHGLIANEEAFSIDASSVTFGPGVLSEIASVLGCARGTRVALFTDPRVGALEHVAIVKEALAEHDVVVYDRCHVEPTDVSFADASRFAAETKAQAYVSVGGGSVIDTCKAAILYATYPADLLTYVNAPIGAGAPVPGPLPPHVACPTTCGTGSECTGIAVFDHTGLRLKTGIASRRLRPSAALVDPTCTRTLPRSVVAASGFDVLCHALESYTARPFTRRARTLPRPMSQGRNPWSDLGALEALRIAGKSFVRAVTDDADFPAREALSWAATLAGIAFGNSGVHLPHAMSYAVAGQAKEHVAHGVSVVVSAPSVFRATASTSPERHREAAIALGGEDLSTHLSEMMQSAGIPNGLSGLGYADGDVAALAKGAIAQKRLVDNAPMPVDEEAMTALLRGALRCWT